MPQEGKFLKGYVRGVYGAGWGGGGYSRNWRFSRPCSGLRRTDEMTRRGTGVLEAPEESFASETERPRRVRGGPRRDLQEDFAEDFAREFAGQGLDGDETEAEDFDAGVRRGGARRRPGGAKKKQKGWLGWLPQTLWGRIAAGVSVLAGAGICAAGIMAVRNALLHDERFVIPNSAAIRVEGNKHVTKAQLLSIFGEDVDRNILRVPLEVRQAELQRLPWVEHATVMRLLPDHLRIAIVERTPVAFVRQGSRIGLVDKNGVMMDFAGGAGDHYSFPVVTGINVDEPLSTRAARMKMFERFTEELDSGGAKISDQLSEVDLSSPEDVKALIPDDKGELLVHFGDSDFLERYNKYKAHLGDWRTQYPRLASVDMRYDRQAVLEMQGGGAAEPAKDAAAPAKVSVAKASAAAAKPAAVQAKSAPAVSKPATVAGSTPVAKTGSSGKSTAAAAKPAASAGPTKDTDGTVHHLTVAKDVPAKKTVAKKPAAAKTGSTKPSAAQVHP
jgi:cell division protein FtsQ